MSLINDALKRAKEVQPKNPSVANAPQLRPIDQTHQATRRGIGLMLPVALALVAMIGLLFVWQLGQKHSARKSSDAAPTLDKSASSVPTSAPAPPVATIPTKAPESTPAASPAPAPTPVVTPTTVTTPAVVAPTAPPQPAPLKLQAIFFHPTRPSAIINGKTVYPGDTVREFRVRAIDPETVTLASTVQTNILSLVR